jgi:hypothetical protein
LLTIVKAANLGCREARITEFDDCSDKLLRPLQLYCKPYRLGTRRKPSIRHRLATSEATACNENVSWLAKIEMFHLRNMVSPSLHYIPTIEIRANRSIAYS